MIRICNNTCRAFASVALLAGLFLGPTTCLLPAAPPAKWVSRGVGGGGALYSPTINPADPREMAVACDMSPQFTSLDAGKTWSRVDFRQLQSNHECAIRFTKDPNIRWAIDFSPFDGGELARPTRSSDGGKTWHALAEDAWPRNRTAYVLYADYENPDRVAVSADYRELWITLDGGRSFEKKITGADRNAGLHLAGAFFDGPNIYLGLNDGLYTSTDGGKTFAKSDAGGLPRAGFMSSFAGGKSAGRVRLYGVMQKSGWAGISGADHGGFTGVYALDLDRKTWVKKTGGLGPRRRRSSCGWPPMTRTPPTSPAATSIRAPAPRSIRPPTAVTTWSDVFLTDHNRNIVVGWAGDGGDFAWSFPEYALGFEVSLLDKNHLLMTDLSCLHASNDGGKTWRQAYTTSAAARPVGQAPKGEAYLSCGLEVTSIWQVLWFDANSLFACATDIKGFRSTDAGKSWSFKYSGHNLNTMYRAVTNPSTRVTYAGVSSVHDLYQSTYLADNRIDGGKGGVLATSDRGATWKPVGNLARPVVCVALDARNPSRLYAAVVHSKEGGLYAVDTARPVPVWMRLTAPPRTEGHPCDIHAAPGRLPRVHVFRQACGQQLYALVGRVPRAPTAARRGKTAPTRACGTGARTS